ncbi:MAG: hypothetical protein ABR501_08390 [Pyrinomonadaceae bacterium]
MIDITTLGTPGSECANNCADLRALTSLDGEAAVAGQVVTVRGVRLEESPTGPLQPNRGGFNSSWSADFITLGTPLPSGNSVDIQFKVGIMRTGNFRIYINIEAQNSPVVIF